MRCTLKKRLAICFAIGIFIISPMIIYGCAGGHVHGQWGNSTKKETEPDQHQATYEYKNKHKYKHKKNGPPPHAPVHGYRAKHKYRYYPSRNVYHDTEKGLYFYLKGDHWEIGASLPVPLRSGLGNSVIIEMDTDKPYLHNEEHVQEYPPKKFKGKKHKKWAKKNNLQIQ
jgi:hypothetical protein